MKEERRELAIGIIIFILIVAATILIPILSGSRDPGSPGGANVSAAGHPSPSVTVSGTPRGNGTSLEKVTGNSTRAVTPVTTKKANSTSVPGKEIQPSPAARKVYVKVVKTTPTPSPTRQLLQPSFPSQSLHDFVTIYSLEDYDIDDNIPVLSFNLVNPPLIIDYSVAPLMITDKKYISRGSTQQKNTTININRSYENAWFSVAVRDAGTGTLVAEDGYGRSYGLQSPRHLVLQNSGNYLFEFDGNFVNVTLVMQAQKEGNIR